MARHAAEEDKEQRGADWIDMPSTSKRMRRFMGAEYRRKKQGKRTRTGMTLAQLADYASTPEKGLPERKRKKRKKR